VASEETVAVLGIAANVASLLLLHEVEVRLKIFGMVGVKADGRKRESRKRERERESTIVLLYVVGRCISSGRKSPNLKRLAHSIAADIRNEAVLLAIKYSRKLAEFRNL